MDILTVQDLDSGNGIDIKHTTATVNKTLRRSGSYDSFYQQARNRTNFRVFYDTPVTGIVMGTPLASNATFPKQPLLMVSGIGPAAELAKADIEPVGMSSSRETLREAQTLSHTNLTGPYTTPSDITKSLQKLIEQQLRDINAKPVIGAGLATQAHIEHLFESVWYP